MRISQVMLSKGWGGAERIFIDLVRGLAEQGVVVQAIVDERFQQKSQLEDSDNIVLSCVRAHSHWDLFAGAKLYRQVRRFNPDLVHCHLSRAALMGGRVAAKLSRPAVVTTHNNIKLKYCRHIDQFLVLTESQRDYLRSQGVSDSRVTKIPNFSNIEVVDRAVSLEAPLFVAYGRMVPKKGFADLICAFRSVVDQRADARLLIGGDGGERRALEKLVAELDLAQQVDFVGWVADVKVFLARGAVFVLPSRDEPFGIVLLEVMARGVPIVTTRTGGAGEILSDETAYFADVADPASLSQAMLRALRSEKERRQKAQQALALFRRSYRKESVIPRTIEYYRRLFHHSLKQD